MFVQVRNQQASQSPSGWWDIPEFPGQGLLHAPLGHPHTPESLTELFLLAGDKISQLQSTGRATI